MVAVIDLLSVAADRGTVTATAQGDGRSILVLRPTVTSLGEQGSAGVLLSGFVDSCLDGVAVELAAAGDVDGAGLEVDGDVGDGVGLAELTLDAPDAVAAGQIR